MKINDKLSVLCYDKITRTGRVIYIHPDNIFAVLEFEGVSGNWREAFMLWQTECETKSSVRRKYTPAEDKQILESNDLAGLAKKFGRTKGAVAKRRWDLEEAMKHER